MTSSSLLLDVYTVTLLLGAVLAMAAALTSWKRRGAPGAMPLLVLSIGSAFWITCELLSWVLGPPADRLFWYKLAFAGAFTTVPAFLTFALQYNHRGHWITRRVLLWLTVEPLLFSLAVWTDSHHGLVFNGWRGRDSGVFHGGAAFWLHSAYSYALLGATYVLLLRGFLRTPALYRAQAGIIVAAALVPLVGNALTIFHLSPFPGRDLTPLGLVISSALITAALFRRGLLDLVPIARDAVVETMNDGVVVLDQQNRVLDLNPAARAILRLEQSEVLGQPASRVLAIWQGFDDLKLSGGDFHDEVAIGGERFLDLRSTALQDGRGRLRGRVVVLRDITPLKQASAALSDANLQLQRQLAENQVMHALLKEQSIRDALTGLYNRRFLEETLAREISHALRSQTPISVAMIDLDYFKRINDRHGHLAGDQILQAMGQLLTLRTRSGDAACRFGGEEFMLLLPGSSSAHALQRIESLRCEFMALRIEYGAHTLQATFSAGVATYPMHGADMATLMQAADVALYAAKASGRNRIVLADNAMT